MTWQRGAAAEVGKEIATILGYLSSAMAQAALNPPEYRHRAERWEIDCDIAIEDGCGRELSARLGNLSDGGFMCECEERLPLNTVVIADLPERGRVRAEIRWVFGWRFGAMILPG